MVSHRHPGLDGSPFICVGWFRIYVHSLCVGGSEKAPHATPGLFSFNVVPLNKIILQ